MGAVPAFTIEPSQSPVPEAERLARIAAPGFGKVFTDHMVTIRYAEGKGWYDAKVTARQPLTLDPATAVLHYAQEIFEGLKAYVQKDGGIARLILPTPLKVAEKLEPTDRLLLNWNRNNPSGKWAPQPPERTYRDHKTGKDVEMTPAQYADHTQRVGRRVLQKLAGKVTESAIHRPTEQDVDGIKKAFTEARREVRDEQFGKIARAPLTMW